jgi:hypothetical protein
VPTSRPRGAQQAKDTPTHRAAVAAQHERIDALLDLFIEVSDTRSR